MMLICTLSANAQFLRTSYFMEGTHYRHQLNPALTPTKGYFNLPVIGAVNATVGSTSLGYQDIIDIIDDGDDFYTKPYKTQGGMGHMPMPKVLYTDSIGTLVEYMPNKEYG